MAKENEILRDILTKKPFTRVLPEGHYDHGYITGEVTEQGPVHDSLRRKIVSQEDFMRELDPAGHLINDRELYPDIWRKNDEDDRWYIQEIPRYAFSFQQIILTKHLTHLCGNDIQFELAETKSSGEDNDTFIAFRNGWAKKNMEIAWYKFCKSVKATGDGAFVGFMDDGKFGWRVLSFLDGDKLYPHYDPRTGRLNLFARTYSTYNENGGVTKRYIDVWDDEKYYRYVADGDPVTIADKAKQVIMKMFSINGYSLEEESPHNFDSIPVAYHRDDNGPAWTFSQESIENYESAFSRLAQSNHDFGLPIMYVKGEGSEEVSQDDMSYASKIMLLPSDGEIGFLNKQDASDAYKGELSMLEDLIYRQSFAVKTPELKSGDTPGVALKIMYSDAYEKAMADSNEYDDAVDKMVEIFSWGFGIESEKRLSFLSTDIRHYLEPYIHVNNNELITNLNTSVTGKFLSRQTASEKNPFAIPGEWERICQEEHDTQMHQLLLEEQKLEMQADINIATAEANAEINQGIANANEVKADEDDEDGEKGGSKKTKTSFSTATGHGRGRGRPKTLNKTWNSQNNEINPLTGKAKSHWDEWNLNH